MRATTLARMAAGLWAVFAGCDGGPSAEDRPPELVAPSVTTDEDTSVTLTIEVSDPDGDPVEVTVGDALHGTVTLAGLDVTYTPAPDFFGSDSFSFTAAAGSRSVSAVATVLVRPVNDAPVAHDDELFTLEDTVLVVPAAQLLTNDTDPDRDLLDVVEVRDAVNGEVSLEAGQVIFTPARDFAGPAGFRYLAGDGALEHEATVTIDVAPVNDPPEAKGDLFTTTEDTPLVVDVTTLLANDVDVDGDPLIFFAITSIEHGDVSLADGRLTFTPEADFFGRARFGYGVTDGVASAFAWVLVDVVGVDDRPPVAVDDYFEVVAGEPFTGDLLANDFDDGGSLVFGNCGTIASGTLTCAPDGTFHYEAPQDAMGEARFAYSLLDGERTVTATATLRISNPWLKALEIELGSAALADRLSPGFSPQTGELTLAVGGLVESVTIVPRTFDPGALIVVDGTRLERGRRRIDLGGATTREVDVAVGAGSMRRSYRLTIERHTTVEQTFSASGAGAGDRFAWAVDIDRDTMVVTAPNENHVRTDDGTVRVYRREASGAWEEEDVLVPTDAASGDFFGRSVAVWGDTVVAGARFKDGTGAVYVFGREGSGWTQKQKLQGFASGESFGFSVALDGDLLVVGAPGNGSGTGCLSDPGSGFSEERPGSGAAYTFHRNGPGQPFLPGPRLKSSNPQAGDSFGATVALSRPSQPGEEGAIVLVGAPNDDADHFPPDLVPMRQCQPGGGTNGCEDCGAAYIYRFRSPRFEDGDVMYGEMRSPNPSPGAKFGSAVATDGPLLVVGAPYEDPEDGGGFSSGAAYVYTATRQDLLEAPVRLLATNPGAGEDASDPNEDGDRFGYAVAVHGDVVVVSAPYEDGPAAGVGGDSSSNDSGNSGAAYVFHRIVDGEQVTWTPTRTTSAGTVTNYVKASDPPPAPDTGLGESVAVWGETVVIGAPFWDVNGATSRDHGAVYVYGAIRPTEEEVTR